jgi:hypothetical protein
MTPEPEMTPEEALLEQSRELDEQMAGNTELLALRHVVAANAVIIGRLRSQRRAVFLVWGLTIVLAIVGIAIAVDVRNNGENIDRAKEAVVIFCEQTNKSNAEAQAKFRQTFPQAGADDQAKLENFLDAGWPIHDCSAADKTTTTKETIP